MKKPKQLKGAVNMTEAEVLAFACERVASRWCLRASAVLTWANSYKLSSADMARYLNPTHRIDIRVIHGLPPDHVL